jgi:surface polysaccharide O-acyltransferase-like enzyme
VYRIFVRHANGNEIAYFLIIWFAARLGQFIYPNLFVIGKMEGIGFIGCFVLGHYIAKYDLPRRNLWYALGIASFILTAVMTYFYVFVWKMPHRWKYYDSLAPNVVLTGIAVFLAGKYANWERVAERFPRVNAYISEFGQSSFGIYLAHVMALEFLLYTNPDIKIAPNYFIFFEVPVAIGIPLFGLSTVTLAALMVYGLKRIPVLGKYVS